ncbi:MAG: pyridoxal phosphate-dependent aminotransferase [Eubacteriales bacterium]|nr:pyridoxal phosphate-dependent aminotransferase [Eubacteriales bacterium]
MALTISKRTARIAPSITLGIDARVKEMKALGLDVIGFGVGEPDLGTPEYIRQAAHHAIDNGMTRYTPVAGTLQLREEICRKLARDNGLWYTPDQIIVTTGAKQALYNALAAIIDPGDEVIIPSPCWVSYPEMVRMVDGEPVTVQGDESNGFLVDAEAMRPYITEKTKAIMINSPNNPNGCVWPREMLEGIAELAKEHDLFIIADEIYEKLIYDGDAHVSVASVSPDAQERTILVNGVSKTYAMTGWRIGYAAAPRAVAKAMVAFQGHCTSNANSIAQHAAAVALTSGGKFVELMRREYSERRKLMHQMLNDIPGLSCELPKGAFYMMLNLSGVLGRKYLGREIRSALDFADALLESQRVAIVPGNAFGADYHARLSYAVSRDSINRGIARIASFVTELE